MGKSRLTAKVVTIIGLENLPLIKSGDDLPKIIVKTAEKNNVEIEEGDIIVISQKIISKSEGRVTKLSSVVPSKKSEKFAEKLGKDPRLVELILKETNHVIKASPQAFVVKDRRGIVCINAGIDKSNVPGADSYSLLPEKPDESAKRIRKEIMRLTGKKVAVIVCDTFSRPFRRGQVEFAIGIAGLKPFKDYRGKRDLFGRVLMVKNVAIADEIACAAELVMGQGKEAVPVAIIKNLERAEESENSSAEELLISSEEDLFRETL